nr:hypothetical protein LTR18_000538 [Exophiala xenobiotica]
MVNKVIVVLGSGPGIGVATGSLFASKGFDVALLSRNAQRLQQDVIKVEKAGSNTTVQAYPVDISDHVALLTTLNKVEADLGPPEVVFFNAARVQPSKIGETTPEYLLEDFKTMNIGLYTAAAWAIPHLTARARKPDAHPSFFFSNSGLHNYPIADLFSLSMQKAAQFNLAGSLNQVLAPQGVHVASVDIGGVVTDEDPVLNSRNIAEQFWKLYQQDKEQWMFDVKLGDIQEFIKKMSGQ